ncbi:SRPBCC domain-containing protein [Agromyces sp. SYSU K20354]|uniref:SRPBCC domain-containing protein n=1 Tax=Agromyces cavernae TaxID=2898659 RepID=UPI001E4B5428|nr:SRPBCC domain-containing protein [Agromyces cavernae]MCD2440980.1 SRPBCC domain-containing protein [Agromyces cavernae]
MAEHRSGAASATRERSAFRQAVEVTVEIKARPETLWDRLTDAAGFPSWNSTVQSIDGPIAPGRRLAIRVPAAPGRTFRPTVVAFDPPSRMTWREGSLPMFRGIRTFTVERIDGGDSRFTMREELSGVMLPLIGRSLPDFVPVFNRYVDDLRAACEG